MRNGVMHDGVDISAPFGTPVRAADNGEVMFSGRMHGYGNVIIVRHDGRYATVYGHNEVNYVHERERVRRGEMIARVGRTGRTTGCNLHFEVRRDNLARNPIDYLAIPATASGPRLAGGAAL